MGLHRHTGPPSPPLSCGPPPPLPPSTRSTPLLRARASLPAPAIVSIPLSRAASDAAAADATSSASRSAGRAVAPGAAACAATPAAACGAAARRGASAAGGPPARRRDAGHSAGPVRADAPHAAVWAAARCQVPSGLEPRRGGCCGVLPGHLLPDQRGEWGPRPVAPAYAHRPVSLLSVHPLSVLRL